MNADTYLSEHGAPIFAYNPISQSYIIIAIHRNKNNVNNNFNIASLLTPNKIEWIE